MHQLWIFNNNSYYHRLILKQLNSLHYFALALATVEMEITIVIKMATTMMIIQTVNMTTTVVIMEEIIAETIVEVIIVIMIGATVVVIIMVVIHLDHILPLVMEV